MMSERCRDCGVQQADEGSLCHACLMRRARRFEWIAVIGIVAMALALLWRDTAG